jgi:hypothetical protein
MTKHTAYSEHHKITLIAIMLSGEGSATLKTMTPTSDNSQKNIKGIMIGQQMSSM